jgi:CPA2 family monovalent cation:H+ antiporter-2
MTLAPEHLAHYKSILIFLVTAGVVAPLFRRLKLSPILGFLAAGFCLGPYGLGLLARQATVPSWEPAWLSFALSALTLDNVGEIAPVAEFGVVFLLFMIGLELSWERLVRLRGLVFGFGAFQVFGCAAALAAIALALKLAPAAAVILGFALALSSTAIVIPELADRKRLGTPAGGTIFSVLLFQDLMVAPLLFLVATLGTLHDGIGVLLFTSVLPACAGIGLVVLVGRLVLRPLYSSRCRGGLSRILYGRLSLGRDRHRFFLGHDRTFDGARRLHRRAAPRRDRISAADRGHDRAFQRSVARPFLRLDRCESRF